MNLDTIPPRKRRAILVLPPEELDRLKYTPQANELFLNEQILLVTIDEMDGILADELERSGLLETGNLVIQSPYNTSNYVHFDKASSNFALQSICISLLYVVY
jgi:hypothetical protein